MTPTDEKKQPFDYGSVERIQTGARMEKRMIKVLKALAEYLDITLGDLLEGIVLHAFVGKAPFSMGWITVLRRAIACGRSPLSRRRK
jgi:hypothetical protein